MRVDGFRFDLASIFTRDADGTVDLHDPPLIAEISPSRAPTGGWWPRPGTSASYQLGRAFPGVTWLQWNGKFRDDVRCAVRGDPGKVPDLMRRLYGSDDLFPGQPGGQLPPLPERQLRHRPRRLLPLRPGLLQPQAQRGQRLRQPDGADENSPGTAAGRATPGAAGAVLALRRRQVKNFCALLLLANGVPMLVAGDELMHTQGGNNNPYNQDNEITWLDWERLERNGTSTASSS